MSTSYENCRICDETVRCRYIDDKGQIFDNDQEGVLYRSAGGKEIILCCNCSDDEE